MALEREAVQEESRGRQQTISTSIGGSSPLHSTQSPHIDALTSSPTIPSRTAKTKIPMTKMILVRIRAMWERCSVRSVPERHRGHTFISDRLSEAGGGAE